jgi:hypothetical protein
VVTTKEVAMAGFKRVVKFLAAVFLPMIAAAGALVIYVKGMERFYPLPLPPTRVAVMAASPFWLPYGLWGIWLGTEWLKDKTKRKLDRLEPTIVLAIVLLVYAYAVLDPSQTISQIVANWIGVGYGAVGGCFAGIVMVYLAMKGVSRENRPFTWATIGVVLGWLASAIVSALFFDWFVQLQSLAASYFEGRPQWLWSVTFLVFSVAMGVVNGLGAIRSTERVKQ